MELLEQIMRKVVEEVEEETAALLVKMVENLEAEAEAEDEQLLELVQQDK